MAALPTESDSCQKRKTENSEGSATNAWVSNQKLKQKQQEDSRMVSNCRSREGQRRHTEVEPSSRLPQTVTASFSAQPPLWRRNPVDFLVNYSGPPIRPQFGFGPQFSPPSRGACFYPHVNYGYHDVVSPSYPSFPAAGYQENEWARGWGSEFTSSEAQTAESGRSLRLKQNDYCQHFVDTGQRPQNFIRDMDLADRFEEYPKLKELVQRKDKLTFDRATPPMYLQMDLKESELCADLFGTKFDVILIDPPWEEYVRRAPGAVDGQEWWPPEDIMNLKIEAIADTPSFVFLWVGDAEGLDRGRACLKKWGFRRCEDICWIKTNRERRQGNVHHSTDTILQHSKEHCLMGIKGTVRRNADGHIIHANIDTDVMISEERPYGSTQKPEELYRIIEHFALGRRRLELFGEDHNIRPGWVTVGNNLTSSNFNPTTYANYFVNSDGVLWQGRGNPPLGAPHLLGTTNEIESLRPKSPVRNQIPG